MGAAQGGIPATTRMMIRGAVVAVLVYFLLPFLTNGLDVSRVCAELCPGTQCTRSLQSLCAGQSSLWKVVVTLLFAGAIIGLDLMLDK